MFKIKINRDLCKGCGLCISCCKAQVISVSSRINEAGYYPAEPSREYECVGCKNCYLMCPEAIIEIYDVD